MEVFQLNECSVARNIHLQHAFLSASHPKSCMSYITQLYTQAKAKRKESAQHSTLEEKHSPIPENIV